MCKGDNHKFHAAGREDIDVKICFPYFNVELNEWSLELWNFSFQVRMLGSGRPFLVEIQNARHIPSKAFLKEIELKINDMENKLVSSMPIWCLFFLLLTIMITVSTFWMQVGVKNLKVVGNEGWALIHEGEAEKQVCVYRILFYIIISYLSKKKLYNNTYSLSPYFHTCMFIAWCFEIHLQN